MADPITREVSDRICNHMNKDHGDSLVLFAKAYSELTDAQSAEMTAIDPHGMNLKVATTANNPVEDVQTIRIEFDHVLEDSEDAHQTLTVMSKQAKEQAG